MELRNTLTGVAVSETMETATRIVDEIECILYNIFV